MNPIYKPGDLVIRCFIGNITGTLLYYSEPCVVIRYWNKNHVSVHLQSKPSEVMALWASDIFHYTEDLHLMCQSLYDEYIKARVRLK